MFLTTSAYLYTSNMSEFASIILYQTWCAHPRAPGELLSYPGFGTSMVIAIIIPYNYPPLLWALERGIHSGHERFAMGIRNIRGLSCISTDLDPFCSSLRRNLSSLTKESQLFCLALRRRSSTQVRSKAEFFHIILLPHNFGHGLRRLHARLNAERENTAARSGGRES